MLARTEALKEECRRLCLQAACWQRESVEVRSACEIAVQSCRSSIEQSHAYFHPAGLRSSYSVSCLKREQLARVFLHAAVEVEKLSQETEDTPSEAVPRVANEAYAVCEKARIELYRHKTEHGC